MLENVVFNCPPRLLTLAMMKLAMPAAINRYSMAVALDSSRANRRITVFSESPRVVAGVNDFND